ncbi:2OG-Fe(II) oxygenase [Hugenholtzia roseola]|uniref:2OG-Fe(II) oxygenase n=1 Tax=Hugenholtzia roseola TaxID=1002 RepID=UPI0003F7B0DD|nr:2OG-Fe(II) oxygenase [Hugenholtzia roseola]
MPIVPIEPTLSEQIVEDLASKHWSEIPNFLPTQMAKELYQELKQTYREGEFVRAGIGSGSKFRLKSEIRGDYIHWLEEAHLSDLQRHYWAQIEQVRLALNRAFFLNLRHFEAHFALYPVGSFYKKHLDQHQNVQERLISCVLYLNENWTPQDEGCLRIYQTEPHLSAPLPPNADTPYLDIAPQMGTLVCMRSDTVWHEVLPTKRPRASLTGWLRRENMMF